MQAQTLPNEQAPIHRAIQPSGGINAGDARFSEITSVKGARLSKNAPARHNRPTPVRPSTGAVHDATELRPMQVPSREKRRAAAKRAAAKEERLRIRDNDQHERFPTPRHLRPLR